MSAGARWRRLDAEHWVWLLCLVHTTLMALFLLVVTVRALRLGMPPPYLLLVGLPLAGAAWLTSAWRQERPWSWWVLTTFAGLALVLAAGDLTVAPSWWTSGRSAFYGLLLLLLAHPDSRARIQPAPAGVGPRS